MPIRTTLIIILFSALFSSKEGPYSANDLDLYKNAMTYIEAHKNEIKKIYGVYEPDSLIIRVSDQIIIYSPEFFVDEIIQKEFYYMSDSAKSKIADTLRSYPEPNFTGQKIEEFSEFNKNRNYNFVLFFSKIAENKIIADLRHFSEDFGINFKDYDNSYTGCNVAFLLYFNDFNEVDTAFYKLICK